MSHQLRVSAGQHSERGRKSVNQDFHGLVVPRKAQLVSKGIAIAIADGISSSDVSQIASQSAVTGFLEDYYCTPGAWSVKTSAERVLVAVNSWLHAQNGRSLYRFDRDRGYVCTMSVLVIRSTTAYVFHVGDTRVCRMNGDTLEPLTEDHRVQVSSEQSYLARALGADRSLDIDYRAIPVEAGDVFILTTDGVHEHVDERFVTASIRGRSDDLDAAARAIAAEALRRGCSDNLTLQIVRIEELPGAEANEIQRQAAAVPVPPPLEPRRVLDGYRIVRELHGSSRSHVYLALDEASDRRVAIKTPSIDMGDDPVCRERFLLEEWIARRIDNPHVLRTFPRSRRREYLYVVTEYIEGQTLAQWMIDNPTPDLATVRGFIVQIAAGLQAFHRLEMLHRDLKPGNVMIDATGTLKLIDFGAVRIAGLETPPGREDPPGEVQYAAPEYFLGEPGTPRSDLFSLGVIAYQMLSGKLPYGTAVPKARTRSAQKRLVYRSVLDEDREIPAWIDDAIHRAVHPDPTARYGELSEFLHDLHYPSPDFLNRTRPPLIERNPVLFWKFLSVLLMIVVCLLIGFGGS